MIATGGIRSRGSLGRAIHSVENRPLSKCSPTLLSDSFRCGAQHRAHVAGAKLGNVDEHSASSHKSCREQCAYRRRRPAAKLDASLGQKLPGVNVVAAKQSFASTRKADL